MDGNTAAFTCPILSTRKAVNQWKGKEFYTDAHHAMALKASEQSIVLLKNANEILPLKKDSKAAIVGVVLPIYAGFAACSEVQ